MKICICNLLCILLIYTNSVQSSPRPSNQNEGDKTYTGFYSGTNPPVYGGNAGSSQYGRSLNANAPAFQFQQQHTGGSSQYGRPLNAYAPAFQIQQQHMGGSFPIQSHHNQQFYPAHNPNIQGPIVIDLGGGVSTVNGIPGAFVFGAFLPFNRRELHLTEDEAAYLFIRILTPASYAAGKTTVYGHDLLFREGKRYARYLQNTNEPERWVLSQEDTPKGFIEDVSPGGFDVLIRGTKVLAEFDGIHKDFFPYLAGINSVLHGSKKPRGRRA